MVTRYRVPARDAEAEVVVTRSRFLCTLRRVGDEGAARALVDDLRRTHHDARHHCSAFVLGPPPVPVERSSDDGEPAGTAGAPMLEVLRGAGLSDTVAVVTRWFGGTLLGAGGLVRAYGDAVRAAVEQAGTRERALRAEVEVVLGHDLAGRVETELRAGGHDVLDAAYASAVTLLLAVDPERLDPLRAHLAEATAGAVEPTVVGERWVDLT